MSLTIWDMEGMDVQEETKQKSKAPQDMKALLRDAAADAVTYLIQTLKDPEAKPELRKSCADIILDRVYGKASQPLDGADKSVTFVLEGELRDYAD